MRPFSKNNAINLFLFSLLLFIPIAIYAQVGIGTTTPAQSAQLEVSSTTKGFLPPRMTQAQRNSIVNPAPGLMIWCSDCGLTGEIMIYNGTAWGKTTARVGRNYYVSASGDDLNNTGLTPSSPWKTIGKVNAQMPAMSPGDSILFERRSWFFGTIEISRSGTAPNPIVFGAYGTGNKPVFIAAEQIRDQPGWKNLGNNIWEYKDDLTHVDVANMILRENNSTKDSFGIKVMSPDPTKLTKQGQFLYDFINDRILFYSTNVPSALYTQIQLVMSVNAIDFLEDYAYLVFENLDFRYYGRCVWEQKGNNLAFRNLNISYIGGADHNGDKYPEARYQERFGNGLQMWNNAHDITITGCNISNVYDAGISPQGISMTPLSVYNLYMRNNVITNCEYSFEFFEQGSTNPVHNVHDIYFENNTCVNAGGGWSHNQRWRTFGPNQQGPNPNGTHFRIDSVYGITSNIYIRNNIFHGATERLYWIVRPNVLGNTVSDYNNFYQTHIPLEPFGGISDGPPTLFYTFDGWKQITNLEMHSYNYDPMFVSESDFHLQPGSSLIGLGIDIGYGKYMGAYPY